MSLMPLSGVTRRSLIRTTVGALAVAQSPRLAEGAEAQRATIPFVPAGQADDVVDSLGVNTHFNFAKSVYGQTDRALAVLDDLGVRHIRDRVTSTTGTCRGFAGFARLGGRVEGICGALGDKQTMRSLLDSVVSAYSDPLDVFGAFEGLNEPNNDGVPWIDETRATLGALLEERDAHGLERVPIVAPALARVSSGGVEGDTTEIQAANLGDLRDLVDLGNMHVYPRVQTPSADIDRFRAYQQLVTGDLPVHCTEAGWFTAMRYQGGAWPTPADVVATYAPRLVMEHLLRGTRRLFLYELLDDYDPTRADRESNFGFVRVSGPGPSAAWSRKPHYRAVKNLLRIMADPGPRHDVGGLEVAVTGPDDLRRLLFAKRDGSRYLALWRDVSSYDAASRTRLDVPSLAVTLTFARRRAARLYRPTSQATAVTAFDAATSVRFRVDAELVVVRIS